MPPAAACPDLARYQQLAGGKLAEADEESLLAHLEHCEACGRKLKALGEPEALVGLLRRASASGEDAASGPVARLIERLSKLRPGETSAVARDETRPLRDRQAGRVPDADPDAGREEAITLPPVPPRATTSGAGTSSDRPAAKETYDFLAPPQAPDELGRLGPYRVLQVLGSGGMGVVFRAEDLHLGRHVALKAMLPSLAASDSARQRFLREARAAAAIKHDHIVTIHQVGEDRGVPFLAMEVLEGETLDARLEREGKLPVAEVLRIGREIALALAAAHRGGLIHRDIKPANIWLESPAAEPETSGTGGRVKILDFGLARATGEGGQLTQQGAIIGTPAYMAPEQAQGKDLDGRCDLFSLGCVLYRLATGTPAFRSSDLVSTLMAVATEQPPAPRELDGAVPAALSDLIMALLAKEPGDRPASATAVAQALQEIGRKRGHQPAPPANRRRWLVAAAAALVIFGPLAYFCGGTVVRFASNQGEVVIATDDRDIEVAIKDEAGTIIDRGSKREYTVRAGAELEVEVTVKDDKGEVAKFATKKFTVSRGGKEVLRVELQIAKKADAKSKPQSQPAAPAPADGDDRKAAEWVLSLSGRVTINDDRDREIDAPKDLPGGAWTLRAVNLYGTKVTDAGLKEVAGLKQLRTLELYGTPVTDAGLKELAGLEQLQKLSLGKTPVTDVGLKELAGLKQLQTLDLYNTRVTDVGLKELAGLRQLQTLSLFETNVTDAGLKELAGLKQLQALYVSGVGVTNAGLTELAGHKQLVKLYLHGTRVTDVGLKELVGFKQLQELYVAGLGVTDAGLTELAGFTQLQKLYLHYTRVTDAGLKKLAGLKRLRALGLQDTRVTDAGLKELAGLKQLETLELTGTRITDTGLKELAGLKDLHVLRLGATRVSDAGLRVLAHLPLSEIHLENSRLSARDFANLRGAFPTANIAGGPKPSLAEDLLAERAALLVRVGERKEDRLVKKIADLPKEGFTVRRADCTGMRMPPAELLWRLSHPREWEFERLEALELTNCNIDNLAFAPSLTSLQELNASGTKVADLQPLFGLKQLRKLTLDRTPVAGLGPLAGLAKLEELSLAGTSIADSALQPIAELPNLRKLDLSRTNVDGRGLGQLAKMPRLAELSLAGSKVTGLFAAELGTFTKLQELSLAGCAFNDEGLKHLHGLMSLKELDLTGTKVTPDGVALVKKALPQCKVASNSP